MEVAKTLAESQQTPSKPKAAAFPAMHMQEDELIRVLKGSLYPGADDNSVRMVLGYCRASGLDPMQKPVHIVPMWDSKASSMRDVVMPGIGLYRVQAARTGQHAGTSEPEFGPDVTEKIGGVEITYPAWCRVKVYRIVGGQLCEFPAKEIWKENYAMKGGKEKSIAPNAMWTKRPYAQLAKCAEAQALRKAFPEFGAAPTADEMEGKTLNEERDVTPPKAAEPKEQPMYPAAEFDKHLAKWHKLIDDGKKTVDEIIATIESKGKLTDDQKAKIKRQPPKVEGFDLPPVNAVIDHETGEVIEQ